MYICMMCVCVCIYVCVWVCKWCGRMNVRMYGIEHASISDIFTMQLCCVFLFEKGA